MGKRPDNPKYCALAKTATYNGHLDLDAVLLAIQYRWHRDNVDRGELPVPQDVGEHWAELHRILVTLWEQRLARPSVGHDTIAAVRPVLQESLQRKHGALTFGWHRCFPDTQQVLVSNRPGTHFTVPLL